MTIALVSATVPEPMPVLLVGVGLLVIGVKKIRARVILQDGAGSSEISRLTRAVGRRIMIVPGVIPRCQGICS